MSSLVHDWKNQYHSYNQNVKLFILTNIFTQIGMGIFMIMYNFYIRELGYTEQVNGNIIAMTALASAIILIPAGILSDKIGRKKLMLTGVVISSVVLFSRGLLEGENVLLIAAFITGISMAFLQVSAIPWLAENSTNEQRVHLFSFHFAVMMAANVVGNILGGFITDILLYVVHMSGIWSVRITLLIGAAFIFMGVFPILKMSEIKKSKQKGEAKLGLRSFAKKNKIQIKLILLFAVAQIIIGFGSGLVIPYLNLYFADRFSANNSIIGVILSLGQAATAIAMFIGPAVVKKVGEVRAVVYLQLLSLPFLLLTAYTENLLIATIGFLFRQALMNAGNPIQMSLMMERVEDSMKGLANSVNQMVFSLGWAIMGPVSTSIVFLYGSYWGYAYVFSITAGLYLIGAVYFFVVFKGITISKIQEPIAKSV
ncbi:MFS transporter [Bacillus timonensis]|nr:MFS transporter [Bacillus timonensis]